MTFGFRPALTVVIDGFNENSKDVRGIDTHALALELKSAEEKRRVTNLAITTTSTIMLHAITKAYHQVRLSVDRGSQFYSYYRMHHADLQYLKQGIQHRFFATSSSTDNDATSANSSSSSSTSTSTTTTISPPSSESNDKKVYWNEEWKRLGLGATLVEREQRTGSSSAATTLLSSSGQKHRLPDNLFFVQLGFGVDQHGDTTNDATKACVRAVRNAIEFNSIPGVIKHVPGGRHGMLIHVKLGVPPPRNALQQAAAGTVGDGEEDNTKFLVPSYVDTAQVAKVLPYGRLLPIEVEVGGISFHSGRVVEELGDKDDVGICCIACVTIGYDNHVGDDDAGEQQGGNEGTTPSDHSSSSSSTARRNRTHETFNTKDGY